MSLAADRSTATGFVIPEGCELFDGDGLRLEKIDGKKQSPPVVLKIPQAVGWDTLEGQDWFDVTGKQCLATDPCRPVAHAKIKVTRVLSSFSFRHWGRFVSGLSGDFAIEFQGGETVEGSFQAKLKNPKTLIICE